MLERTTKAIKDIEQECQHYMSTEWGENNILNPKGRTPIAEVNWFSNDFRKEIKLRVDLYVESYLQSSAVQDRFANIQKEIISFSKRAELTLFEMENEWINDAGFFQGDRSNTYPALITTATWFFGTSLIVFGLGYNLLVASACGLVWTAINVGLKTPTEIKNEYESCKKLVCKDLCSHLEKGYGLITEKMIYKVTDCIIHNRIKSLQMLITQTSEKRDRYIANQKSLTNLDMILAKMEKNVTKLQNDVLVIDIL